MNTKVTVVGVRLSRSGFTGEGCGMAWGVLALLLMCTRCTADGEGYSDYNLVNMPHYDYDPPSAPRAPYVPADIDDVDYPDPSAPHLDYKFDEEPHEKNYKAFNGWSQEIRKSKNPKRPVGIEQQHVERYDLENEVLQQKVDNPNRRRKSRLNRRQQERVAEPRRRPSFRSRHDDIEDYETDDVSYSNQKSHDDADIDEERVNSRRSPGSLLRRKPRARSMDDVDMFNTIKTFEADMTRTSPIDDEYAVDRRDVLVRKVTDALDQVEDLKRLYAINKKKKMTTEDAMMDPKIRARLQRPERTTVYDGMARWWAQHRGDFMKDLLPGVENNNRPPNYQPEDLNTLKANQGDRNRTGGLEQEGSEHRDDLDIWSGRRAALMKRLIPQLKDANVKTELPKSTTDIEVGPILDHDENERDVWTGLKRNKIVEQVMRKLIMDKGTPPLTIQTPITTVSEDDWWAHRRAGILNKINRPEMKRLTAKKSTRKSTTKRTTTTMKTTTTKSTTTTSTVYIFPELEKTQKKLNVSEVLSYEEKSRLSILKKALRKENQIGGTTRKPPVLMVVTQQMNTVVMVGPLGAQLKRRSMRVVRDDSPQRLALVKRLMREKLVKNAKNIYELVDNWDREVCDYVDMSLLSVDDYSASDRVHHSFLASTVGIAFVLVF